MLILLLLFPLLLPADETASEKYCFPSISHSQMAEKKFKAIQVPSDVVTLDENCLIVQMRPHRRELIQRYILSAVSGASVSFSSAEIKRESCKLKVEKIRNLEASSINAGLNQQMLGANESTTKGKSTETMQIDTLKDFQLSVDQDEITGSCKYLTPDRYEIAIEVLRKPRPIVPENLPPGTIVVLNTPPPDQQTMRLQTELQLTRGEKIELGNLIQKLQNDDRKVNINPSLNIEKKQQNASEKVFLSLQ